ncbi:hypothetical protein K505DRAFT_134773 [Melanomma pulvis-pyrius CBS 109.77]|uniref:Uncharacterized protein n=1 Tax=Melanomma pulvis-pyrius CBS 109.77 TaxID=1314802 RepID=A0A6A6XNA5_9PLEO|nr:hypothetical protein K505DRAFT_134773 [Melanomma pulvis-pyrius CBS 109.77]
MASTRRPHRRGRSSNRLDIEASSTGTLPADLERAVAASRPKPHPPTHVLAHTNPHPHPHPHVWAWSRPSPSTRRRINNGLAPRAPRSNFDAAPTRNVRWPWQGAPSCIQPGPAP